MREIKDGTRGTRCRTNTTMAAGYRHGHNNCAHFMRHKTEHPTRLNSTQSGHAGRQVRGRSSDPHVHCVLANLERERESKQMAASLLLGLPMWSQERGGLEVVLGEGGETPWSLAPWFQCGRPTPRTRLFVAGQNPT